MYHIYHAKPPKPYVLDWKKGRPADAETEASNKKSKVEVKQTEAPAPPAPQEDLRRKRVRFS